MRPDPENFIRWNDEMFQKYDPDSYHNHPWWVIRTVERMRCGAVRRLCDRAGGRLVYDVGCGAGNLIHYFDGYEYIALDISEVALAKAVTRRRPGVYFIRGDATAMPYRDASVPCVFASEIIEHLLDPRDLVNEIHRVLTPDGVAVITIPNEQLINNIKKMMPGVGKSKDGYVPPERMGDEWHITEFSAAKLRTVVSGKFSVVRQVGIPSALFPIRYVFQLKKI